MSKETKELTGAAGSLINSAVDAAKPGQNVFQRISHFFDDLFKTEAGIKDANKIGSEAETISNEDVDAAFDGFQSELTNIVPEDAYDIRHSMQGAYSVFRFARRKAAQKQESEKGQ